MAGIADKKRASGVKRELNGGSDVPPAAKKAKLLDNTDDEDSDADAGLASLQVNEDYARRFEYNKKREETHRCKANASLSMPCR